LVSGRLVGGLGLLIGCRAPFPLDAKSFACQTRHFAKKLRVWAGEAIYQNPDGVASCRKRRRRARAEFSFFTSPVFERFKRCSKSCGRAFVRGGWLKKGTGTETLPLFSGFRVCCSEPVPVFNARPGAQCDPVGCRETIWVKFPKSERPGRSGSAGLV
jgi:hypothetical protein